MTVKISFPQPDRDKQYTFAGSVLYVYGTADPAVEGTLIAAKLVCGNGAADKHTQHGLIRRAGAHWVVKFSDFKLKTTGAPADRPIPARKLRLLFLAGSTLNRYRYQIHVKITKERPAPVVNIIYPEDGTSTEQFPIPATTFVAWGTTDSSGAGSGTLVGLTAATGPDYSIDGDGTWSLTSTMLADPVESPNKNDLQVTIGSTTADAEWLTLADPFDPEGDGIPWGDDTLP